MGSNIPRFLLERPSPAPCRKEGGTVKTPFIERGLDHLAGIVKTGFSQWETSSTDHFFQKVDARVKLAFLLFFVVIVSLKREIVPELMIALFIFILVIIARLNVLDIYRRVLFFGFVFGFLIALPSGLSVITRGEIVLPLVRLSKNYTFLAYRIPREIGMTKEGVYGISMLTLRVLNSLALSLFVLYTTRFSEILRALKAMRVPDTFIMVINLAYKHILLFAETVHDMHLAKKSRLAGEISRGEARRWIAGRIALLFKKSALRLEEIHKAMLARGFTEEVKIFPAQRFHFRDWCAGAGLFLAGALFLWMS